MSNLPELPDALRFFSLPDNPSEADVADFWQLLADRAETDAEVAKFLLMFDPWARRFLANSSRN